MAYGPSQSNTKYNSIEGGRFMNYADKMFADFAVADVLFSQNVG